MSFVALSPKFKIFIPKDVHAVQLAAGSANANANANVNASASCEWQNKVIPELPRSAARGMFPGIDTHMPNDPDGPTWPGGCDALAEPFWVPISERKPRRK